MLLAKLIKGSLPLCQGEAGQYMDFFISMMQEFTERASSEVVFLSF